VAEMDRIIHGVNQIFLNNNFYKDPKKKLSIEAKGTNR
jgi:hypothetical protein